LGVGHAYSVLNLDVIMTSKLIMPDVSDSRSGTHIIENDVFSLRAISYIRNQLRFPSPYYFKVY